MRRWRPSPAGRGGPLALVALAIAFNLIVLRAEVAPPQHLNDGSVHLQMIRWAEQRIEQGHLPLDGWYPYLALGSSRFHNYQSTPHILTAYLARVVGAEAAFGWTLYLLLSLWPISVYAGARLLGRERWEAGAAALLAPLVAGAPGLGYEQSSYTWQGRGVWSQLWAMWTLPLAWGLTWRAVSRGRGYALAAAAIAATVSFHFLSGYLALLVLGVWVVARPSELIRRAGRAAIVGAGGLLAAAWILVPLLGDRAFAGRSVFLQDTIFQDSFGASRVMGWLLSGELFDDRRLPLLSLMAAAGLVICLARFRDDRSRALVGVSLLSLVLFFGRSFLGPAVELLPGGRDLLMRRFVIGVHLGGILLGGVGAAWAGRLALDRLRAWRPRLGRGAAGAAVVVAGVVVLAPAWVERAAYAAGGARTVQAQREADRSDGADVANLVATAKRIGPGRMFAGLRGSWGGDYKVGFIPVYSVLANQDADALGFTFRTPSLSTDVEAFFDDRNPDHYRLFNVRYLILPEDREPPVRALPIAQRGRHLLWALPTEGYLGVVDTIAPIPADRSNIAVQTRQFLDGTLPGLGIHPLVAFDGIETPDPTLDTERFPEEPAGEVHGVTARPTEGSFSGEVTAARGAVVILRATFDPRWEILVDGEERPGQLVAPSYVGVRVSPGRHTVSFRYRAYDQHAALALVGVLALLGLWLLPRWGVHRRVLGEVTDRRVAPATPPRGSGRAPAPERSPSRPPPSGPPSGGAAPD